jgi:hypothetical protein
MAGPRAGTVRRAEIAQDRGGEIGRPGVSSIRVSHAYPARMAGLLTAAILTVARQPMPELMSNGATGAATTPTGVATTGVPAKAVGRAMAKPMAKAQAKAQARTVARTVAKMPPRARAGIQRQAIVVETVPGAVADVAAEPIAIHRALNRAMGPAESGNASRRSVRTVRHRPKVVHRIRIWTPCRCCRRCALALPRHPKTVRTRGQTRNRSFSQRLRQKLGQKLGQNNDKRLSRQSDRNLSVSLAQRRLDQRQRRRSVLARHRRIPAIRRHRR